MRKLPELWVERDLGYTSTCWFCLLAPAPSGYCQIYTAGKPTQYAHRVFYKRHVGPILPGHTVDHLCHRNDGSCPGGLECLHRRCINPAHLKAGPHADNIRRSLNTRLTPEAAAEIRATPRGRGVYLELAEKFGVGASTIYAVWNGKSWI